MQQTNQRSRAQIPRAIRELATKHQFEELLAVYGPKPMPLFWLVLGPCCTFFGSSVLALLLTYSSFLSGWSTWKVALLFLIGIAWLVTGVWLMFKAFSSLVRPSLRVYVFVQGIVYAHRKHVQVFRWRDIESLYKEVHNAPAGSYLVQLVNGLSFLLSGDLYGMEHVGRIVEQEVARSYFAAWISQYDRGIPLMFGEITISPEGICVKHKNATLPWHEVKYIDGHQTTICIRKKGEEQDWASVPLWQVPNACVLRAVVRHVHRQQRYASFLRATLFPKRPS